MSMDDDSFLKARYLSDASFQSLQRSKALHDLISFLAVVQEHGIAILPITWQAARLPIATGATGKINEALLNLRSSFAFKCVSDKQKETENTQTIMEVLTNEVKVFGHRSIRDNPNIVDLQGVCWDVSMDKEGNNTVWPVLVFEKTPYEDLYSFLMQPVGRELCFADRLRLCTDISTAIWGLHSNDIIHGDIKPGNVLIYQGDNGFTAKVTDFGYSTRIASDEDRIVLPKTYPWNAPEHDCGSFTPDQARKMDIFSLGMLCMWTLFEKHLSNLTQLPQAAQWATRIISSSTGRNVGLRVLRDLKCEGRLIMLAQQLLRAEENLTEKTMQALDEFLSRSMLDDPNERANTEQSISCLLHNRAREHLENDVLYVQTHSFKLTQSMHPLYEADYEVRQHIRRCLEHRAAISDSGLEYSEPELAFQHAICSYLGFGGSRDDHKAMDLLRKSGKTAEELKQSVAELQTMIRLDDIPSDSVYDKLRSLGHVQLIKFSDGYLRGGRMEEAKAAIERETKDIDHCIGRNNYIWCYNVQKLSILYAEQGRYQEAESLQEQVTEVTTTVLGAEHPSILTSAANLASIYNDQARLKDAETLGKKVAGTRERVFGMDHPLTLISIGNLAITYKHQGRWREAEELEVYVMKNRMNVLGTEHPDTLTSMGNLATTYNAQGRWKEAEDLQLCVLEHEKRLLGPENSDTLTSMSNLAITYHDQGRWDEAESLETYVIDNEKRVLGLNHPHTLKSMDTLAAIYRKQGRYSEAKRLGIETTEALKNILGVEHRFTLAALNNLALVYGAQEQWQDAEDLGKYVIEMKTKVFGENHASTLASMSNLAVVYSSQQLFKEAQELCVQIVETKRAYLGAEHPSSLLSISNLATIYSKQRLWDKAEELGHHVLETRKKVCGPEHPQTLSSLYNLAFTLRDRGEMLKAISNMQDCNNLHTKVLGPDHPHTVLSHEVLTEWRLELEETGL